MAAAGLLRQCIASSLDRREGQSRVWQEKMVEGIHDRKVTKKYT